MRVECARSALLPNFGLVVSKIGPSAAAESREENIAPEEDRDEHQELPQKRRRLFDFRARGGGEGGFQELSNQVTNGSHRSQSSRPGSLKPVNLNAKKSQPISPSLVSKMPVAVSRSDKRSLDRIQPKTLVELHESMRVDIHQINPTYDERVTEDHSAVATIPFRCSVATFYRTSDEQSGKIIKSIGYNGRVSREMIFSKPFIFSANHFYVSRRTRKPHGQWDNNSRIFGFADKFQSIVNIESKGYHITWPPLLNQVLCVAGPTRGSVQIAIHMGASKPVESSKEQVAKSTTAKATRAVAEVEAPKPPQLRAKFEVPEAAKPPVPWRDGDTKAQESLGNSRVSRHRNILKPLYNLKALSSIQGRHPKPTRRNRLELGDPDHGGITITYSFGRAQAAGPGIRRETTIAGLKCAFCLAPNRNLDELRLHLHTDHGAYKFRLRKAYPPRAAHFIELTRKHRSSPAFPAELQRTIQLGRPISLSDLDKHLSGDESWSRRSSPNTSNADDATMDESHELRPKGAIKHRKIYYAPAVARPPYDTNTKRLLRTGDELVDEDVEVDEAWLHLKQKDTINDFEEAVVCPRRRDSSTVGIHSPPPSPYK
ncbi:hypothetical protein JHW43_009191 [Diplocarpon mali]|nr:hypothetical protein JHW43_009191 [Diplocarpon mali]